MIAIFLKKYVYMSTRGVPKKGNPGKTPQKSGISVGGVLVFEKREKNAFEIKILYKKT